MNPGGQIIVCSVCKESVRTFKGTYGLAVVAHPAKKVKAGVKECEGSGMSIYPVVKE